jgi:hypothetical protein
MLSAALPVKMAAGVTIQDIATALQVGQDKTVRKPVLTATLEKTALKSAHVGTVPAIPIMEAALVLKAGMVITVKLSVLGTLMDQAVSITVPVKMKACAIHLLATAHALLGSSEKSYTLNS